MRYITLTGLTPGADCVRRLQVHGTTLAAFVGDEQRTHAVHWLRLPDGAELRRVEVPVGERAFDPALSPDLGTLAYAEAGEAGPHFVLEDAEGGRRTVPFLDWTGEGPPDSCACLAFSGDGGHLRASFDDGSLAGWDVRGAAPALTDVMVEEFPPVVAMAHGPVPPLGVEGHVIACRGSMLYLRIPPDRQSELIWCGHEVEPVAAAFAPNGALFAVAFTDRVQVWGTGTPFRPPAHATLPVTGVRALAFSPDGATLATARADGRVLFWSGDMAEPRSGKDGGIGVLGGVAFAPDGGTCVVGGEGGRLAVWGGADEGATPPAPPPPPPAAPPAKERARKKAAPPPPPADPCPLTWVAAEGGAVPPGAAAAGHEAGGQPLYAARGARKGQVVPGKARPGLGGACIGIDDREITFPAYEVLVGELSWRACRGGEVPPDAVPCGHDRAGRPLYLARARVGGGLHPGKVGPGMSAALIPYGGAEFPAERYEVLVSGQAPRPRPAGEVLLAWDFENTMSAGSVSIAAGVPADPAVVSGFISQTGGGPAEVFGEVGTVFLTRRLGSNNAFAWVTLTRPVLLVAVEFRHWHNHNPGYPTDPGYEIQLQIDSGDGWEKAGEPLPLSAANHGGTDRIEVGVRLEAGSHKMRWHPRKLRRGRDTSSEFFALKDVRLLGTPEG